MRKISMERVEQVREDIYRTIVDKTQTYEQKVALLAKQAESLMEVLEEPEDFQDLFYVPFEQKCICNLNEGNAPLRPRYIVPDYPRFLREGSGFLQLDAPVDLWEALNSLLIFYKHVPSITNYPVFIGCLDELIAPYIEGMEDTEVLKALKLFLTNVDRTILDSFCHANVGPKASRAGMLLLQAESELVNAVPNLSMRYDEDITSDEFLLAGVKCALKTAKPSFANHKMFQQELGDQYVIASCYNGLLEGGGSYTLVRLLLSHIADRAENIKHFKEQILPQVLQSMAAYMDERIRFIVEESNFFESSFLAKEGFIDRKKFTAMFGMVGLAECVNTLLEKEGKTGRFGHDETADRLGVAIMDQIHAFNQAHVNPYCEATDGHFLLHAQVGISDDSGISPGTRIPIGEEPEELVEHLKHCGLFHKYFPSGTGDIFPIDVTVHRNPEFVMDLVKGAFRADLRYLSFYGSDNDLIRITGYLVKRSEMEKLKKGENVMLDTTALGLGAAENCKILERKVR